MSVEVSKRGRPGEGSLQDDRAMHYPNVFQLVAAVCREAGVSCVLVGGFAVNYYKVTRQTADVDFLIAKEDFEKIVPSLKGEGYKMDFAQDVFARLKGNRLYLMDLDFMFVDRKTLIEIIAHGRRISVAGQKLIVPCLNHLIALKLHSIKHNPRMRESKDLPDIINLARINEVNIKSSEFRALCLKYGTGQLYRKIIKGV